ncbi:MAG: hypothetical protein A2283_02410 [Lentisphaerae bacterium RIFOXYA12_FULL_48_11]|nr:MAG: hypothetical protein A2283_02410 [Lentisphaerae bacterium RIFOXYA12_FULL_48_11]
MVKLLMKVSVLFLVCVSTSYANGYRVLCVKSSKATAMGEAFIVQADDPSAIAYNPAGIAQLNGNQVNVNATVVNLYTEHASLLGQSTDIKDKWQVVPSIFLTSDFGQHRWVAGLGLSLPNGLSSEWADDSFARYVSTYSDLTVADISPTFGMKVGNNLMLGGGLNYYYSKARLENMIDAGVLSGGLPVGMDLSSRLDGKGSAWGANVGAIYKINLNHSVAVTYKLPYSITYDGDLDLAGTKTPIEAQMDFPAVVVAGYAFRPTDKWKIEFNVDWTDWESTDDISIHFKEGGMSDSAQQQDMRNAMTYKIGTEYKYSSALALRAGYIYNENATLDSTWRPSMPDTDCHLLSIGFGYTFSDVTIDGALQYVYYETRTINNNVDMNEFVSSSSVDGTYRSWAPCASLSATYRF